MDKAQSYEEVFNNVVQTQILMEEKLGEAAGSMGVKPSYDMNVEDLYASYNNFRIDNNNELFIWFTDSQVDRIGSTDVLYEWVTKPKGKKPYTIKETFQSLSGSQKDFCLIINSL